MKYKTTISEFNHEDLVNIFSTALYGNNDVDVDYDAEKYADIIKDQECYEDKIAEILLNGGEVKVIDCLSEEEEQYIPFGRANVNWRKTEWEEFEVSDYFSNEQGKWGHIAYTIDLKTLIMGINSHQEAQDLAKELLEDEEGDLYTAWNMLQYAVFDDIVYG